MKVLNADIRYVECDLIVQQCNCVTKRGLGLSASLEKRFPGCSPYNNRVSPDTPGSIYVHGKVVSIFGQYYPGVSKYDSDSPLKRLVWFKSGLEHLSRLVRERVLGSGRPQVIAFPYRIGCGLAGGNWVEYERAIEEFEHTIGDAGVVIVCKI